MLLRQYTTTSCRILLGGRQAVNNCNCNNTFQIQHAASFNLNTNKIVTNFQLQTRCFHKSISYLQANTLPDFTKNRYNVKRGNYNQLNDEHIKHFKQILGESRVLTDPSDVETYNIDWIKNYRGYSSLVLKPKTSEEVSLILQYCNNQLLAVVPQGGNTGLVGGSVPVHDEIILSTSLMNQIISFDNMSGILICEAGCVLETLDQYLRERDYMMPLDLGAKGTCNIGGNISTNAGGLRLLRYGNLHGTVLGVEAVLANGEIIDCLSALKKDNTGYHLKHLFIGSEGTLGVVTKVAINCSIKPLAVNLAYLGMNSFDDVLTIYKEAKQDLGEVLSSCEMMDRLSLQAVVENLKLNSPLTGDYPFYMLLETSGSNHKHDLEKLEKFLEKSLENGTILDCIIASEPSKIQAMWEVREQIAQGLLGDGYLYKYDFSLPLKDYFKIVPELTKLLGKDVVRVCGFGHIGDGNIHLNVTSKEYSADILNKIQPYVFEFTSKLKGSVSAEHGIGFQKQKFIHYSKSNSALNLMQQIKHLMDPNKILNPYKVLPNQQN